jgi:transcriptional regulator with XRE-family HTH domain
MTYIKEIRLNNNLTRKEMAYILNLNLDNYRKIERGERATSSKVIKKLKTYFKNIDANKFF